MTQEPWLDLEETMKKRRNRKRWQKIATALCALVVFCTTYALILPAITLEKGCPIPEHTHGPECYTQVTARQETALSCAAQIHQHTDSCYDEHHNPVCGYADFLVHVHEECCYDGSGNLRCTLPEVKAHSHDEGCYAPGHSHGADCYTQVQGPLTCDKHVHTESCWAETRETVCGQEESPDHTHGEECYRVIREQTCGEEGDHTHGEECYAWEQELTCTQEETPVLVCRKPEIMLHRHTGNCYDENGQLVCGMLQVLQHQHGEECFVTQEIPVDRSALTCQDETHEHGPQCYGQWQLVCPLEEHTHDDRCTPAPDSTEETQETEATETTEETKATEETTPTKETEATEADKATEFSEDTATADASTLELLSEEKAVAEDQAASEGVDIADYIDQSNTMLAYSTDGGKTWLNTDGATNIPGNAEFRFTVNYKSIPREILTDANGKAFFNMPNFFRDIKSDGNIHDTNNTLAAHINVSGQKVELNFLSNWLSQQETHIHGSFYVTAKVDLNQIPGGGNKTIKYGEFEIQVPFETDLKAKYCDLTVQKEVGSTVIQNDDGCFLEYTITVTAGQDDCPDVTVNDTFVTGKDWVDSYVLPDNSGSIINEDQTMTWTIGDMDPGTTRTLKYKVKLASGYTGGKPKEDVLKNAATVYSESHPHNTATAEFKQESKATLEKRVLSETTSNGNLEITYYVWVTARDTNYPLRDVLIKDSLDNSVLGDGYFTNPELRKHIYYKADSFKLYQGDKRNGTNLGEPYTAEPSGHLKFNKEKTASGNPNGAFEYHVGPLQANESRTLVYTVVVEPGFFTVAGNEDKLITNRVAIYWVDENNNSEFMPGQMVYNQKTIARKAWTRKIVGASVTEEQSVTMTPDKVYETNGTPLSNVTSFTVPKGSLQYQVLVNEAGDWDVSKATLTDKLESPLMKFVGYVRVDAYKIDTPKPGSGASNTNQPKSNASDTEVLNWFDSQTAAKTFWVKIDEQQEFSFTPGSFSQETQEENYAYRLTYYAKSVSTGSIKVENTFTLSGDVYYLGKRYEKVSISSKAEAIVSVDSSFGATKQALFYEAPIPPDTNGYLYWAIRVSGTALPEGFDIQDMPGTGDGLKGHGLTDGSLVGVYTGPNDLSFTGCTTLSDVMKKQLTQVDARTYSVSQDNSTVTLNKSIPLGDQSLYILVKTQPEELPTGKRDVFTYQNGFRYSFEDGYWVPGNPASQTIYGKGSIFKELADVFTYDGTDLKILKTTSKTTTQRADYDATLLKNQPGEYVGWLIHLNHAGTLSGKYRVVETVPEGMEIAYIRMYWYGDNVRDKGSQMVEIHDPGSDWKVFTNFSAGYQMAALRNHYYVKGQTAIMEVSNLVAGGATDQDAADKYAVELQIVCKLTDKSVLQGGVEKAFTNTVNLQKGGQNIDGDSSSVTLSVSSMKKSSDKTATPQPGTYPFVITVNEKGIDLMPDGNQITLEDQLGSGLSVNVDSVKVQNTKTGADLDKTQWTYQVVDPTDEGTEILRITLPDHLPLRITYSVSLNATPGQTVSIQNHARWQGYASTGGSSVNESYEYKIGGTVSSSTKPQITVEKRDESNLNVKLQGAKFSLTKMELRDGQLVKRSDHTQNTEGTTDKTGEISFEGLEFETIYRLVETEPPQGYVCDSTPHYVLFSKIENETPKEYPDYVKLGVHIKYSNTGTIYTYTAKNHKGEVTVQKQFAKADGTALGGVLNGTYKFGLYTDSDGTNQVQKTSVTYAFGTPTDEAKFKNVTLDTDYYVFELDDNGNPIKPGGTATVSGIPFVVNYDHGQQIRVTAAASTGSITVTNRMNYRELPQTGGVGTGLYRISGAALALLAGCMLTGRENRKRIKTHK